MDPSFVMIHIVGAPKQKSPEYSEPLAGSTKWIHPKGLYTLHPRGIRFFGSSQTVFIDTIINPRTPSDVPSTHLQGPSIYRNYVFFLSPINDDLGSAQIQ